jgi:hypothetical protein
MRNTIGLVFLASACGGEDPPGFFSKTGYSVGWMSAEEEPKGGISVAYVNGWNAPLSDADQTPWHDGAPPNGQMCLQDPSLSLLVIQAPLGDKAGCSGRSVLLGTDADEDGDVWDTEVAIRKRLCATEEHHTILAAGTHYRAYVGCPPL